MKQQPLFNRHTHAANTVGIALWSYAASPGSAPPELPAQERANLVSELTDPWAAAMSIVHDLRNPLTTIHSGAELLAGSGLSQHQIQRIAHNMCCASIRMRELLEEFLERSGVTEKQRELCDIRELVASAVEKITASADFQCVHIVQNVPDGLIVALDRRLMRRVLVNLLVNALEMMPDGGTINISVGSDHKSVTIRIRDTGPGITPEMRSRLFEPFASAGKSGGVGLGLTLSRQAVTESGGEIWAEPTQSGACFVVRLPRFVRPNSAARTTELAADTRLNAMPLAQQATDTVR